MDWQKALWLTDKLIIKSLGDNKIEVQATKFNIRKTEPEINLNHQIEDESVFTIDGNEISILTKDFVSSALGGHLISNSLATDMVKGGYNDLQ